ncbi:hypothetical protein ACLESO_26460 [Pyxidicoccus sp. 3LG]
MRFRNGHTPRPRGQAMVEYVVVTAALLGFGTLSWPYLVDLLRALDRYYQSIYYVILCPLP